MDINKQSTIVDIVSVLFIILFLYTGISKVMDYSLFKEQISTSPSLASVARYIAGWLPWVEFLVTILLIVPRWRLKGLYASLGLMVMFTGYIIGILMFNKHIPCSCGGVLEELSWRQHIIFNSIFIALAVTGIVLLRHEQREYRMKSASITYK